MLELSGQAETNGMQNYALYDMYKYLKYIRVVYSGYIALIAR